jgi:hypothetical protein
MNTNLAPPFLKVDINKIENELKDLYVYNILWNSQQNQIKGLRKGN